MSNPFVEEIAQQVSQATELSVDDVVALMETPPKPEMGDYAFPCFTLAKTFRKAPNMIAEELVGKIQTGDRIAEAKAIGPYLNFFVGKGSFVGETLAQVLAQGANYGRQSLGQGKTVAIDFSSPNIAKPFTIAHLRTTAIGNALCRLYEALGWQVAGINYMGDWGAPHGMNIAAYKQWGDEETVRKNPPYELFQLYVKFNAEVENNPSLKDEAQAWTRKLEEGDEEARTLWTWFRSETIEDFKRVYRWMGIEFSEFTGESVYHEPSKKIVADLKEQGLAVESDGALVVELEDDEMPPGILQTSHGTLVYLPRDLAAAIDRKKTYDFDKMIYVVGNEQSLHFKQLFKVLSLMGHDWAQNCVHVPFGLVNFKAGKMSTRRGNVIFLEDVLKRAVELTTAIIDEKNPDLPDKEAIAEAVGIGAIVFADLDSRRMRDVVFDWDEILNFNGETGPYVQYTHARYCSMLRRFDGTLPPVDVNFELLNEAETLEVVKCLEKYPKQIQKAADEYEPSIIATYLIELCTVANRFYNVHQVISDDAELTKSRVALVYAIKTVLASGLDLLGMKAPERM